MSTSEYITSDAAALRRELLDVIQERRVTAGEDYYGLIFKNRVTGKVDVEIAIGWDNYVIVEGANASCEPVLTALRTWLPEEYDVGSVLEELLVEHLGTTFHCYEYGVNSVFLVFPTALVMVHRNAELN